MLHIGESLNAYLRGQVISCVARETQGGRNGVTEFIEHVKNVDQLHSVSSSDDIHREIIILQPEFDSVTNAKATDFHPRLCPSLVIRVGNRLAHCCPINLNSQPLQALLQQ